MDPREGGTEADGPSGDDEIRTLARRWPRELIQAGEADALAARWVESGRAAEASGRPRWAGGALTPALVNALFEARRARRLVRGLEEAEAALRAQALGIGGARGVDAPVPDRISRLLLVSEDGSDRFFRKISSLLRQYSKMLEVYVCACDEQALGGAVFGEGRRARAVLVDHKEAVVQVLRAIAGGP
ncbi:MAG: hypothetical protein U0900_01430 [Myxococcota bacterium]